MLASEMSCLRGECFWTFEASGFGLSGRVHLNCGCFWTIVASSFELSWRVFLRCMFLDWLAGKVILTKLFKVGLIMVEIDKIVGNKFVYVRQVGVFKAVGFSEMAIGGKKSRYVEIERIDDECGNMRASVPVEALEKNEGLLRPLLPHDEARAIFMNFIVSPQFEGGLSWVAQENERKSVYDRAFKSGSAKSLDDLIRLVRAKIEKTANCPVKSPALKNAVTKNDRDNLKNAIEKLGRELAFVLGLPFERVQNVLSGKVEGFDEGENDFLCKA